MKLALVGPTYPYRGGIAHYTTLLCKALRERHQVLFCSFKRQYPAWLFPGHTDRDLSQVPLQIDCEYTIDPLCPVSWLNTFQLLRKADVQVVIFQWWIPYWALSFAVIAGLARHLTSMQVLFVCHNVLPHERHLGDVLLTKLALSQGHSFITHAEKEQSVLESLLPGREVRRTVLPTYAPLADTSLSREMARSAFGMAHDQEVLLFFGFVREYKGLRYLLLAMPEVLSVLPRAHLWVVGEFWDDPASYQQLIRELEIEAHVTIDNRYVPDEELPGYFRCADTVVLPYTDATQSAVVQLAYGFGCPVITTDVGGLREVVQHGVTGLLVPARDSSQLAKTIIQHFQSVPCLPPAEIRAAAQKAFSWDRVVRLIEEVGEV